MPNDRRAPELDAKPLTHEQLADLRRAEARGPGAITYARPRADPYDLWKEGASVAAGFLFWVLTGALGMAIGFAFGYAAGKVFG